MNNPFSFKAILPHLGAILVFYALTFFYFQPVVTGGKKINQSDVLQYKGVSKEIVDYKAKGENILWTNALFGGMPTFQIHTVYKSNLTTYVDKIFNIFFPHPIYYIFIAMVGFYILMMVLRVNVYVAVMGAIAFGFSTYLFTFVATGHNSKAHAISYMAPALAGLILAYRGKVLAGASLFALFMALQIRANHLQMTYYFGFLIIILVLCYLIDALIRKEFKSYLVSSSLVLLGGLLAIGSNTSLLWSTYDYGKYTMRGKSDLTINPDGTKNDQKTSGLDIDYATSYSYGVGETMTLLIPNYKGGSNAPIKNEHPEVLKKTIEDPNIRKAVGDMSSYFGDLPITSGPVYAGAAVMFLCILSFFLIQGPLKWALLVTLGLTVMLSWGKNFMGLTELFMDYFPGYNKFRAVCSILIIAELIIPVLATLAVDAIVKNPGLLKETLRNTKITKLSLFYITLGVVGGITLLVWMTPTTFTDVTVPDEYEQVTYAIKQSNPDVPDQQVTEYVNNVMPNVELVREAAISRDAIRSFAFIIIAAGLLLAFAFKKINVMVLGISLSVIVMFDLVAVDRRYLSGDDYIKMSESKNPFAGYPYYRPHNADLQIQQDKSIYRVHNQFSRLDQDGPNSYFHKSTGGYHGAKLKRYQEMIDFHLSKGNMAAFDMLNVKYFISPASQQDGTPIAQQNPGALGNAWFVRGYRWVPNADSEIVALRNFDPRTLAFIDERYKESVPATVGFDSTAKIVLDSYFPDLMKYSYTSSKEGMVVFSEIYYPSGWNAYIDGNPAPHFCANYILRAMILPAGSHKVEFRFEPKCYYTGEKVSLVCSSLLLLSLAGVGAMSLRKKKEA